MVPKVNPINNAHVIGAKFFGNCTKSDNCPVQKKALTKLDILQSIFHPSKLWNGFNGEIKHVNVILFHMLNAVICHSHFRDKRPHIL